VPVVANTPLKAGDLLFKIDPTPYEAQVKAIEAQLKLSDMRLSQMTTLYERDAGRAFDVQQRQSEVDQLKGQLEGAQWNLDKTVVRAPADGYVINQIDARYVEPGQEVELTFKFAPGTIYSGRVESVLQAVATGQAQASGTASDAQGARSRAIRCPREARR
jgi:multidrug resistance efflux pump